MLNQSSHHEIEFRVPTFVCKLILQGYRMGGGSTSSERLAECTKIFMESQGIPGDCGSLYLRSHSHTLLLQVRSCCARRRVFVQYKSLYALSQDIYSCVFVCVCHFPGVAPFGCALPSLVPFPFLQQAVRLLCVAGKPCLQGAADPQT